MRGGGASMSMLFFLLGVQGDAGTCQDHGWTPPSENKGHLGVSEVAEIQGGRERSGQTLPRWAQASRAAPAKGREESQEKPPNFPGASPSTSGLTSHLDSCVPPSLSGQARPLLPSGLVSHLQGSHLPGQRIRWRRWTARVSGCQASLFLFSLSNNPLPTWAPLLFFLAKTHHRHHHTRKEINK